MDWPDKYLYFIVLLCGLLFLQESESAVDSSENTALKFCECMMDIEMKSPYFSNEEKESITMVSGIMTAAVRRLSRPDNNIPIKVFLHAYATAVISIVTSESDMKEQKKEAHISALQQCSEAITGSVDIEFLKENIKLITAFERSKVPGNASPFSAFAALGQDEKFIATQQFFPIQPDAFRNIELHDGLASTQNASSLQEQSGRVSANPQSSGSVTQIQITQNIETVMRNTLMSSSTFTNVFNPGIAVELATDIAKGITKVGMVDYNPGLTNEIVIALSTAVSNMPPRSTSFDYAGALSKVIATFLSKYNLTHPDHGKRIANGMISHLEAIARKRFNLETLALRFSGQITDSASYEELSAETEFDSSQTIALSFENDLAASLSHASDILNFFCADFLPARRAEITYKVIKAGLSGFDERLSSEAARTCANELRKMSSSFVCSYYARVISKIITNGLKSNEMLSKTDVSTIVKKMVEYLQRESAVVHQPHSSRGQTNTTTAASEHHSTVPRILQPSFPPTAQNPTTQQPVQQSNMPSEQSFKTLLPVLSVVDSKSNVEHSEIRPTAVQHRESTLSFPSSSLNFKHPMLQQARTTQPNVENIPPNIPSSDNPNIPENLKHALVPTILVRTPAQNSSGTNLGPSNATFGASSSNVQEDSYNPTSSQISYDAKQLRDHQTAIHSPIARNSRSTSSEIVDDVNLKHSVTTLSPYEIETSTTLPRIFNFNEQRANPHEQFATKVYLYKEMPTTEVPFIEQISPTTAFSSTATPEYYFTENPTTTHHLYENTGRSAFIDGSKFNSQQNGNTTSHSEKGLSLRSSGETHRMQNQQIPAIVPIGIQSSESTKLIQQRANSRTSSTSIIHEKKPQSTSQSSSSTSKTDVHAEDEYDHEETEEEESVFYFEDPSVEFAQEVTSVALSSMSYIKSTNFDFNQLCSKVSEFAPVLDILPVMNCSELEIIHYILNVLRMVTKVLSSV